MYNVLIASIIIFITIYLLYNSFEYFENVQEIKEYKVSNSATFC